MKNETKRTCPQVSHFRWEEASLTTPFNSFAEYHDGQYRPERPEIHLHRTR
jgi:hypothetical protein